MVDVVHVFAQCKLEEKKDCVSQSLVHKVWTVDNFLGIYIYIISWLSIAQNTIDGPHCM